MIEHYLVALLGLLTLATVWCVVLWLAQRQREPASPAAGQPRAGQDHCAAICTTCVRLHAARHEPAQPPPGEHHAAG